MPEGRVKDGGCESVRLCERECVRFEGVRYWRCECVRVCLKEG